MAKKKSSKKKSKASKGAKGTDGRQTSVVNIPEMAMDSFTVKIVGVTPYLSNKFPDYAKIKLKWQEQQKRDKDGSREPIPPEIDRPSAELMYEQSRNMYKGKIAIPCVAFRKAMISATRPFPKNVSMILISQSIFVTGMPGPWYVSFTKGKEEWREDPVADRLGSRHTRYCAHVWPWAATLHIEYSTMCLGRTEVMHLLEHGGFGVGVGGGRPEKGGEYGRWKHA